MNDLINSNDPLHINYIKIKPTIDWDQYFMFQAMMASFKSKDPNTKVGCVFVDQNNHQITMGYNGFVAGIDESQVPWGNNREVPLEYQKYGYVVHSEANAILHANRSLENSKVYVTLFPCQECAKLLASSKVNEIIYLSDKYNTSEESKISRKIFDLCQIKYRQLEITQDLIQSLNNYLCGMVKEI